MSIRHFIFAFIATCTVLLLTAIISMIFDHLRMTVVSQHRDETDQEDPSIMAVMSIYPWLLCILFPNHMTDGLREYDGNEADDDERDFMALDSKGVPAGAAHFVFVFFACIAYANIVCLALMAIYLGCAEKIGSYLHEPLVWTHLLFLVVSIITMVIAKRVIKKEQRTRLAVLRMFNHVHEYFKTKNIPESDILKNVKFLAFLTDDFLSQDQKMDLLLFAETVPIQWDAILGKEIVSRIIKYASEYQIRGASAIFQLNPDGMALYTTISAGLSS